MNDDTPPPLTPSTPVSQPNGNGGGSEGGNGKKIALGCSLGCLVSLVICAVVGYFVYTGIKNKVVDAAASYTSEMPIEIVEPATPQAEVTDAISRFDAFRSAMSSGGTPEPLVLSESDINALIYNHPLFEDVAGKGIVAIEDNKLTSTISLDLDAMNIPVPFIAEAVKGRYFNGVATLSPRMTGGQPGLYIEELRFNGAQLPREIMEGFRQENLLDGSSETPSLKAFIDRIEDIRIEYDQLKVIPKTTGAGN
ncbi:MAG: hypothetical protein P1U86_13260 [Verrucomicrobiales bacterium]|nr:hypothetical protein [Verrucomicrobiales bacterium]